jgi:hypothetical protein
VFGSVVNNDARLSFVGGLTDEIQQRGHSAPSLTKSPSSFAEAHAPLLDLAQLPGEAREFDSSSTRAGNSSAGSQPFDEDIANDGQPLDTHTNSGSFRTQVRGAVSIICRPAL